MATQVGPSAFESRRRRRYLNAMEWDDEVGPSVLAAIIALSPASPGTSRALLSARAPLLSPLIRESVLSLQRTSAASSAITPK